jgi:hypothetical protein
MVEMLGLVRWDIGDGGYEALELLGLRESKMVSMRGTNG